MSAETRAVTDRASDCCAKCTHKGPEGRRTPKGKWPNDRLSYPQIGRFAAISDGLIWQWIDDSKVGALNGLVAGMGLISEYRGWLSSPTSAVLAGSSRRSP